MPTQMIIIKKNPKVSFISFLPIDLHRLMVLKVAEPMVPMILWWEKILLRPSFYMEQTQENGWKFKIYYFETDTTALPNATECVG